MKRWFRLQIWRLINWLRPILPVSFYEWVIYVALVDITCEENDWNTNQ